MSFKTLSWVIALVRNAVLVAFKQRPLYKKGFKLLEDSMSLAWPALTAVHINVTNSLLQIPTFSYRI